MTIISRLARAGFLAGILALTAACSSTSGGADMGGLVPQVPDGKLPPQRGGYTDDPADGFQNVQPGSEPDFILTAGRRVYFGESSASLDDTAKATLNNQIAFLQKYPKWYVKLQGFADDPGGDARMRQISQQRADAVMNYMIANGVAPNRLWAKGYGKERVVRECNDRACKVQNRRVISNLRLQREDGRS